jgi:putative ABC transport system permease protein
MGIPLLFGRFFDEQDVAAAAPVVMINESLAQKYWPDQDPVGKRLKISFETSPREIVGVVSSVKHFGLESMSYQEMYFPDSQSSFALKTVVVRASSNPSNLIGLMKQAVRDLASDLPLYDVKVMTDRVGDSTGDRRFTAFVLGVFAVIALLLAAGGIYSVVAYSVSQTKREIGIRMALGARRVDVLALVLRKALLLSLKGATLGLISAVLLTRVLTSLLFGLRANDPLTLALTTLGVVFMSLIAGFLPAYRATNLDPASVLRSE